MKDLKNKLTFFHLMSVGAMALLYMLIFTHVHAPTEVYVAFGFYVIFSMLTIVFDGRLNVRTFWNSHTASVTFFGLLTSVMFVAFWLMLISNAGVFDEIIGNLTGYIMLQLITAPIFTHVLLKVYVKRRDDCVKGLLNGTLSLSTVGTNLELYLKRVYPEINKIINLGVVLSASVEIFKLCLIISILCYTSVPSEIVIIFILSLVVSIITSFNKYEVRNLMFKQIIKDNGIKG